MILKDTISFACGCVDTLELLMNCFPIQLCKKKKKKKMMYATDCDLSDHVSAKSVSFMAMQTMITQQRNKNQNTKGMSVKI